MTQPNNHRSPKLNILYVAHSLPYPPTKGEKIRAFHQIRELTREHRVHLVCGIEEQDDVTGVESLAKIVASVQAIPIGRIASRLRAARSFVIGKPRSAHSHASPELRQTIEKTIRSERIDAILASTVAVAESVRHVDTIPKALDFMDVTSELWRASANHRRLPLSWLHRIEARRLANYEVEVARCFDSAIFVSQTESRLFRRRAADVPVAVVGNGVDLNAFVPVIGKSCYPPEIVFTGSMDYFPNIDAVRYFCNSILPRVREAVPAVSFTIVGRNPTRAVRRLAQNAEVTVTGSVPDVRPYLQKAAVAVVPFRISRGIQNKILESMASGVPTVGTSLVLDPLEVTDADGARRADDPTSFTREVVDVLRDPEWWALCAGRARRFVERCHRWDLHSPSRLLIAMVEKRRRYLSDRT